MATLEWDIKATLFDQIGRIPAVGDGATLFKTITTFFLGPSLQLTFKTLSGILALNPADFGYKIPTINTKLSHFFILLASYGRGPITEAEKMQHTFTIYAKIKQPASWAQWTRLKMNDFDSGALTNCQSLMNGRTLKQMRISSEDGTFSGRSTTLSEDIAAMMA